MTSRISFYRWRPRLEALESRDLLSYSIVDLGTLGGDITTPSDINDKGQVVGSSETATDIQRAFLWDPVSGMHDLGSLTNGASHAEAINNLSQVVGWSNLDGAPNGSAFLWERGIGMKALPPLSDHQSSRANGINESGQIAGWSKGALFSDYTATLWDADEVIDVGAGAETTRAWDINNAGQIVMKVSTSPTGPSVLWQNGSTTDIGALGPYGATALEINNRGQVAGHSPIVGPGNFFLVNRPFLYEVGGSIQNLGAVKCRRKVVAFAIGEGINDKGEVVGWHGCVIGFSNERLIAAVWSETEGWKDLNKLIPPNSGWELTQATAINNNGQIVGIGYKSSSIYPQAYLLNPNPTPVPPPSVAAALVNGLPNEKPDSEQPRCGSTSQPRVAERTLGESAAVISTPKGLHKAITLQPVQGSFEMDALDPVCVARTWAVDCNPFGVRTNGGQLFQVNQ